MRIVTFDGSAVKRQKKLSEDKILLTFYSRSPVVVTPEEWERGKKNLYYDSAAVKRCDVVRSL